MKRRLFLKKGGLATTGFVAAPYIISNSCAAVQTPGPVLIPPTATAENSFQLGAEFFDLAISELRVSGNGPMAPAEAEIFDLMGVAEQIYNQAEVQAEIPIDFAESSAEIMDAAAEIQGSVAELTPIPANGYADLAQDFAMLKVLKSTSILKDAADIDVENTARSQAAMGLSDAAEQIYVSLEGANPAEDNIELIEGAENLLAYSEQYVAEAEMFSGEQAFMLATDNFRSTTEEFSEDLLGAGAAHLLATSENVALGAEYYAEGIFNLNEASEILNGTVESSAEELVPFAEMLMTDSAEYVTMAEGVAAELGAAEMLQGAEEILAEAETNVLGIYGGGMTFESGAEQYIGGTLNYLGTESYIDSAETYLQGAETFESTGSGEIAMLEGTESLYKASEDYAVGAEAINFVQGAEAEGAGDLISASEQLLEGAELLPAAEGGVQEQIFGASEAIEGAEIVFDTPENMEQGSDTVEIGAFEMLQGAEEFVIAP